MATGREDYIHGTARDEQTRLARLNHLLNRQSIARLSPRAGDRILDVGCGFGLLAHEIATRVGAAGCVVGVEREAAQIEAGERMAREAGARTRAEIRRGDAYDLPLSATEWGSFDVAHARFLLEHVARPADVVSAMVRAVRPGGRIVLEDDDHDALIVYPPVPAFEAVWRAYARTYEASGKDPRIGRRLVALLAAAGAAPVRCDWPFFGACAGSETFDVIAVNCRAILHGARDAMVATGGITPADFDAGIAAFDAWCGRDDVSYWYCTFWAEGVRR